MPEPPPGQPSAEESLTYGRYLDLERLLSAQHPRSGLDGGAEHHDELLFIVQHQTTELWFKLILHELRAVRACLDDDLVAPARKGLARVKRIMDTLAEQWAVLATLTPSEYTEFRDVLATSSGFESFQYRCVEFLLGNKSERMLRVFADDPAEHDALATVLAEPTVYDAFLAWLARRGHAIPASVSERDVTTAWEHHEELVPVLGRIYEDRSAYWTEYALCEDLVDLEEAFQQWRFRHLRTVQRIIGSKPGTGGSSGVDFLKRALDRTFFPELYTLRAHLGEP